MLVYQGSAALSAFRLSQSLGEFLLDQHDQVDHRFCYFVDAPALSSEGEATLLSLIPPGAQRICLSAEHSKRIWVVPRLGTVSPWSSKATDIVHGCGLDQVRRVERGVVYQTSVAMEKHIVSCCVDPLTESVIRSSDRLQELFTHRLPQPSVQLKLLEQGRPVLEEANQRWGLALNAVELDYVLDLYQRLGRNPFQSELMMFAQVNSEHCRHKIFNADWVIDDDVQLASLFAMIRHTHASHPDNVLVAYHDNAAVLKGTQSSWLLPQADTHVYDFHVANKPIVLKVETHNHPTAISPFPGAATGSGGEIRDEAATGRGAKSKAGLVGFSVSDLLIPGFEQPWERDVGKPAHLSSSFEIIRDAPIGAAAFNNEFGRPNIGGYFRTFLQERWDNVSGAYCGYHKPIMIAGGIGNIMPNQLEKRDIPAQSLLVVLGGPAFAIGLGGGSASSRVSQSDHRELDFASVQRANPQMQRRCQEVINACYAQGEHNPILSIHDVGAGGLSNALPELVDSAKKGARLQLRDITVGDAALSPVEIWCNESQERFVLAIEPQALEQFQRLCHREGCPFAVVGQATQDQQLILSDTLLNENVIDLPMPALFEQMPRLSCQDQRRQPTGCSLSLEGVTLAEAAQRVLTLPAVASKRFLITIGDRSVGGLVSRDQMVGPWQVPVADVAVTCSDFCGLSGEAMAMGERAPIAMLDHAASARMAVAEALTNIAAASIESIKRVSLSANWMAAPSEPGEGAGLFDAVHAIAMQMCPQLGIAIPVGKDSLSMQCSWEEENQNKSVTSPVSLVITAAAAVDDVRLTLTPQLKLDEESDIVFIDLSSGHCGMGATALSQVYRLSGGKAADVHDVAIVKRFFECIQALQQQSLLLAYHDRSDGGLFATLTEMMFASHCGLTCDLSHFAVSPIEALFNEELGAVIQFKQADRDKVYQCLERFELQHCSAPIACCNNSDEFIVMTSATEACYREKRVTLQRWWEQTGYEMAKRRDNPECVQQEFDALLEDRDPGLSSVLTFEVKPVAAPVALMQKPKVAILREQGINGHLEMAAAFMQAGFEAVDVHMSDIVTGRVTLDSFSMVAACGGFSYGDVLGAGRGWALTVLSNSRAKDQFSAFFERADTLTLGVCNGCQMLSQLKALIPGANHWPLFLRNRSEQFEARYSLVQVQASDAMWLQGMQGSVIPVVVSHGEGRAVFDDNRTQSQGVALRYVDHDLNVTERYPMNPNGSAQGVTGVCSDDGRALIMMPHPERVFRTVQCSWSPAQWGALSPWSMLFQNAWNLFR